MIVHIVPETPNQAIPVVAGVGNRFSNCAALGNVCVGSVHFVCQFHQLGKIGVGILVQIGIRLLDRRNLNTLFDSHTLLSFLFKQ